VAAICARAKLFLPTRFVLNDPYQTPGTEYLAADPLSFSQNVRLALLQLQKVGCFLSFRTDLKSLFEVRCAWYEQAQAYDYDMISSAFWDDPSPQDVIEAFQRYQAIEREFKAEILRHLHRSERHLTFSLPIIFTVTAADPQPDQTYRWVSCSSCRHVGIYPRHFGHDVDCMLYYDRQGHELDIEEEEMERRENTFIKASKIIKAAYVAARSARFEFGERPRP
jgi:hypothetical protein